MQLLWLNMIHWSNLRAPPNDCAEFWDPGGSSRVPATPSRGKVARRKSWASRVDATLAPSQRWGSAGQCSMRKGWKCFHPSMHPPDGPSRSFLFYSFFFNQNQCLMNSFSYFQLYIQLLLLILLLFNSIIPRYPNDIKTKNLAIIILYPNITNNIAVIQLIHS